MIQTKAWDLMYDLDEYALLDAVRFLREAKTIYYTDTDILDLKVNQVIVVRETDLYPQYIIIRSDQVDKFKEGVEQGGKKFVHLRDMPQTDSMIRLGNHLENLLKKETEVTYEREFEKIDPFLRHTWRGK